MLSSQGEEDGRGNRSCMNGGWETLSSKEEDSERRSRRRMDGC